MMKERRVKSFNFYTALLGSVVLVTAMWTLPAQAVLVHVVQNITTGDDASIIPPSTLPSADFLSPDINFNTDDSASTELHDFLNNPTFFNEANGFDPNDDSNDIFLLITAETFLEAGDNSFVVGHDDGVVLDFEAPIGNVVDAPGPTGFVDTPFIVTNPGAAGLFSFTLQYAECCFGPANLVFTINDAPIGTPDTTVPEPASLLLLGSGLAGLAFWRGRRQG